MNMEITDECINCGACAAECPTNAICEPGETKNMNGKYYSAISTEHFFILDDLCNDCAGFELIKCAEVCPMNAFQIK
jgi:ferredoxin